MAGCGGGRFVEGELEKLRAELRNYYGVLNELREGLNTPVPEKPEALLLWQQCEALHLPLVAGGLMDQPHIWILEIAVIREEEQLFEIANAAARGNNG